MSSERWQERLGKRFGEENAMRRFLTLALLVMLILCLVGVSSGMVLATTRPFRPDHPIFPVQYYAEQAQLC
jgi:cation transporter-like permease